jgi:hypothetical protein
MPIPTDNKISLQEASNLHSLAIFLLISRCLKSKWKSNFRLTDCYDNCRIVRLAFSTPQQTHRMAFYKDTHAQPQSFLQSINEERTLVAHVQQLLLRVPRPHCLLALLIEHLSPSFVLAIACPTQDECHNDRCDTHAQSHTETNRVLGSLSGDVDVRACDSAQVADGDEKAHAYCAL